jgi:mRNA interferase RelE/StbE
MIQNPFEGPHIKKLRGRLEGKCRYDVGTLRIIYYVDTIEEIIYVEAIGPRGDIYK